MMKPLLLLITASVLFAKTEQDSVLSLDRMVITATRTERLASAAPSGISVITKEQIENSPAKNIDDLLEQELGVQVKRPVGMGEGVPSDLVIRGIPGALLGSRVLILVDGVPTNASGTPFLVLSEIPLEVIRQVEIVRGPYSSLYGANAFAGVVNIITVDGSGETRVSASAETSAPFSAAHTYFNDLGSAAESAKESYHAGTVTAGGAGEKISWLLSTGGRVVGNYLMSDSAIARKGDKVFRRSAENFDYEDLRLFGKLGISVTDKISVQLNGRFFDSELGFGKTKQLSAPAEVVTEGTKWIVNPSVQILPNQNLTIRSGFYYRGIIGEYLGEEPTPQSGWMRSSWRSVMNDWQGESQTIFSFGEHNIFTAGFDILKNKITFGEKKNPETGAVIPGTFSNEADIVNGGLYVQDEIAVGEKITAVPGARVDCHSEFGFAVSPKIGAVFKLSDRIRFRSSAGRAFRAPTLAELYLPQTQISSTLAIAANSSLKPEYLWAFDGSAEFAPAKNAVFQGGVFYNSIRDLIGQSVDLADLSNPRVTHKNSAEAWSRGVEISAKYQPVSAVGVTANSVFQQSRDIQASKAAAYFKASDSLIPLDYIPQITADAGVQAEKRVGKLTVTFTLTESFVGKRSYQEWSSVDINNPDHIEVIFGGSAPEITINPPRVFLDPYFRTDGALSLTLPKKIRFTLNMQNLFNAQFEESGGTRAPGRFMSLKASGDIIPLKR